MVESDRVDDNNDDDDNNGNNNGNNDDDIDNDTTNTITNNDNTMNENINRYIGILYVMCCTFILFKYLFQHCFVLLVYISITKLILWAVQIIVSYLT